MIRNLVIEYVDKNGEGEEIRIVSLCRDITKRMKAENALSISLSEKDLRVRVDPKQFERLFMNLIGNAIN